MTNIKNQPKAVRTSSRGNQNFEAAGCCKTRKIGSEAVKTLTAVKPNLTAVKTNLTAVKTNLTRTPTKYKFHKARTPTKYKGHKVRPSTSYKGHKVQIPAKYKGHKVQIPHTRKYKFHKEQISCFHPVTYSPRTASKHKAPKYPKANKSDSTAHEITYCKELSKGSMPHQNKHTPYGPHNLPNMVLCTKKGPDNA